MLDLYDLSSIISVVLGLLAIPPHCCIAMVNLQSLRKEGKLSPSDMIFMFKAMVNFLIQSFITPQVLFYIFFPKFLYIKEVYAFLNTVIFTLTYFNFWLTVWLSAHYYTNIANFRNGFFIWLKGILSNYLSQILFLTALAMFIISVLSPFFFYTGSPLPLQSSENSTEAPIYAIHIRLVYLVPMTFLGVILPFCLILLCLLFTFSFLVRHVLRVKNNDSGSSRPNLQAHVTALRTIFFLLFVFTFICVSQALRFIQRYVQTRRSFALLSWNLRIICPSFEVAVIFQASKKLRRIIQRRTGM